MKEPTTEKETAMLTTAINLDAFEGSLAFDVSHRIEDGVIGHNVGRIEAHRGPDGTKGGWVEMEHYISIMGIRNQGKKWKLPLTRQSLLSLSEWFSLNQSSDSGPSV
jgi:hypothetical protein